jgi:hypothetical protein
VREGKCGWESSVSCFEGWVGRRDCECAFGIFLNNISLLRVKE